MWKPTPKAEALKMLDRVAETQKKDNINTMREVAKEKFRVGRSNKFFGRGSLLGWTTDVFKESFSHWIIRKLKGY